MKRIFAIRSPSSIFPITTSDGRVFSRQVWTSGSIRLTTRSKPRARAA
jgi:hypothetical protein